MFWFDHGNEVSMEVGGRAFRRRAAAVAVFRALDLSVGAKFRDPQQVVGGADQIGGEIGTSHAPIA